MATIQEKIKNKKIISFKFKACLGRNEEGKQVFKCHTWYPPEGLTPAKCRKEAARAAAAWEIEAKQVYSLQKEEKQQPAHEPPPIYTFGRFVNEVWIPLCVRDGSHRPATVAMYTNILKLILPRFEDYLIHEITAVQISQYLVWLRNEYRTARGKPLAEKSIRHHYNILSMIFNYAEKQDIVTKSPMKKVDAPKVRRKAVDALSEKEAQQFFIALGNCSLDFRCILQVLITTGLRRGECIGLQWQDIDFQNATLKVQRSATYTPETGVVVSEPKTPNSIRTIPVMKSTLALLKQLQKEQMAQHPTTILSRAFVFPSEDSLFEPRDPNAVTKHMKRFIRAAGLPDVSPHDLRHTCASLLLSSGADIKSVQEILGHADARTTLNFYVKADLKQMRMATEKYAAAFNL